MTTLILNGRICDGSGREPEPKDLLLKDERIAAIGAPGSFAGTDGEIIDAADKIVAPGFIDVHAHGEIRKLRYPERKSVLMQGVTTEVDGNCGMAASNIPGEAAGFRWQNPEEYVRIVNDLHIPVNTVMLAGHNSIRRQVMGDRAEAASPADIKAMQKLMEDCFAIGAAGWSTGLTYLPGKFSGTDELRELARVSAGTSKIYATHMRSEGDDIFNAAAEAAAVAKAGSGRLQISHLKTIFPRNYDKIDRLLENIEQYRGEIDLHADRYPYIYSSTILRQILPPPYDRIVDISVRLRESAAFQAELTGALKHSPRDLATTILTAKNMTLAEIAGAKKLSLEQAAMEALMESTEQNAAYLCMSEKNLLRILALPYVCAGSDGISCQLDDPASVGHPRAVGTFPKFYHLVSRLSSTGEAVRKMSGLPATVFRIPERGFIRENYIADLVIFDEKRLNSEADFGSGKSAPIGIERVMVSGKTAWEAAAPDKVYGYGRFISID